MGEALLAGRRLHPANVAFGRWCREQDFGDLDRFRRADAMWLAENWDDVQSLHITESHPTNIRAAYNAALAGERERTDPATPGQTPSVRRKPLIF